MNMQKQSDETHEIKVKPKKKVQTAEGWKRKRLLNKSKEMPATSKKAKEVEDESV